MAERPQRKRAFFSRKGEFLAYHILRQRAEYLRSEVYDMCNTCGCNNNRSGNGCGCCALLNEISSAIRNLFTSPCNSCGCGCNNNRSGNGCGCGCNGNNRSGNGCGCGCNNNRSGNGCGCGCNNNRSGNGCGCGCNRSNDLSGYTGCGNYDSYYARQYGLCNSGCSCNL